MKVTIATGLYPPEVGGPATYAKMLEDYLPAEGIEIKIVPFGWVRHYPKIIRHFIYGFKLWRQSASTDCLYALDPVSVGLPAVYVSRLRKVPLLVRLGGDYAWEQGRVRFGVKDDLNTFLENRDTWPLPVKLLAKIQTYVVRNAVKIIVPSEYLKSVIEKWGIDEDKITVIFSALYPLRVEASQEQLRQRLEYKYPTIVSAGRLVPWKGFSALLDVVNELKEHYPQIVLIIVGDGGEKSKLEKKVALLDLTHHVRFTGPLSKDALGATIKTADVFVLNTAYEGLSHQILEVMDIGIPIVTTNAGGNPELITDGVEGYLVEFNDVNKIAEAITRVLNHPESKERIVQSARLKSKRFVKEEVIKQIAKLLKSIHAGKQN